MPDQPPATGPAPSDLQASLHVIAQVLRQAHPLGPESQRALADLVDDLGNTLRSAPVPSAEVQHLAESTAHLLHALHHGGHDHGLLANARDRLEQAILGIEGQAPVTAGIARRMLDALANIGI